MIPELNPDNEKFGQVPEIDDTDTQLGGYTHEEYIKLRGDSGQFLTLYPFFEGTKTDIATVKKQLNIIKNELGMSKSSVINYIFKAGIEAVLQELKGKNKQLDNLTLMSEKLSDIKARKQESNQLRLIYNEIDNVTFTEQQFDEICLSLGKNPDDYKGIFSIELSKSELIRRWLANNLTDDNGTNVYTVKIELEKAGLVGQEKDWSLVKNIATKFKCARGEYGKWYPPVDES